MLLRLAVVVWLAGGVTVAVDAMRRDPLAGAFALAVVFAAAVVVAAFATGAGLFPDVL